MNEKGRVHPIKHLELLGDGPWWSGQVHNDERDQGGEAGNWQVHVCMGGSRSRLAWSTFSWKLEKQAEEGSIRTEEPTPLTRGGECASYDWADEHCDGPCAVAKV